MDKETFSPFRAKVFIYSKFIIEIDFFYSWQSISGRYINVSRLLESFSQIRTEVLLLYTRRGCIEMANHREPVGAYAVISQRKSGLSWSIIDGLPFN